MTRARQEIIPEADIVYLHAYSRCVRRSFIMGDDPYSGKNYDHRKDWVVDKLAELSYWASIIMAGSRQLRWPVDLRTVV